MFATLRIGKKNYSVVTNKNALTIIRAFSCWTTKIRTWTNRTKTCCATITP